MTVFYANNETFPLKEILIQEKYTDDISLFQEYPFKRILDFIQKIISKDDLIIDEILVDEISYFTNRNEFNNKKLGEINKVEFSFFNGANYRGDFFWLIFSQIQKIAALIDIDFVKKNSAFLRRTFNEIKIQFNDLDFLNESFKKQCSQTANEICFILLEENSIIKVNKIKDKILLLQQEIRKKFDRCTIREFNLAIINDDNFFSYKKYSKQEIINLFNLLSCKTEQAVETFKKSNHNHALYLLQDIMEGLKFSKSFVEKALHKKIFYEFLKIENKITPFIEKIIFNLENVLLKRDYFLIEKILEKEVHSTFLLIQKLLQEKF